MHKKLIALLCALVLLAGLVQVPVQAEAPSTPLADVRVRQALAYAIDMDLIVDTLFEGKAASAISFTSPGDWLAVDLPDYKYNPEKAKELLAEANWPADYTLDVVYYYGDQQTVDLMSAFQNMWEEVGVKSAFRKLEGDLAAQLWVAPEDRVNGPSAVKWDLAYGAIAALVENEFYNRFSSTASNNSHTPKNEEMDALLLEAVSTTDTAKQMEVYKKIQKLLAVNVFALPLYHQVCFIYTSKDLDMKGNQVGNDQFSYEKNILDWTIARDDKTMYTNSGPEEFFHAPFVNPGNFIYQELVFDRLLNADGELTPTDGRMAKSFTVSEDSLTMEFELHEGLKWHDDTPLTAEDVKFTYELMAKVPASNALIVDMAKALEGVDAYLAGEADEISGIVVDGNKVSFKFSRVAANALPIFAQWPILPKHLLKDADPATIQQDQFWQKPIGSGPFKVGEVVLNNYATLERWDGYFKQGTGDIAKIHMFASGENDTNLINNATAGKIDYAWNKNTEDAKAMEGLEHMTVHVANIRYTRCLYFNQFPHEPNIK